MKTKLLLLALFVTGLVTSQNVALETLSDDFTGISEITNAGDDRLFVVEQEGRIRILHTDGSVNEESFLDVSGLLSIGGERGLLGLAFHPQYAANGYFYINYTNTDGDTVLARYSRSTEDADSADPDSGLIMLTIEQPFDNHNGGCLRFGLDGYLYVAMGDGGSGGDPGNRAQNLNELLGKILRLDVNAVAPYIPASNPYVGIEGDDEIWAYGLRNPWKFSFNAQTGEIWIADVGQGNVEEINRMPASTAGVNYGWKCYEGNEVFTQGCTTEGITYTMPAAQYVHQGTSRCSVTGGYVYNGTSYPGMVGKYFFGDYCSNEIGIIDSNNTITWTQAFEGGITTFGQGNDGELYVGTASGVVSKITDTTARLNEYVNGVMELHPNPADDEIFIALNDGIAKGKASIFNVNGQLIIEQELDGRDTKIDTSKLQAGVYTLSVQTDSSLYDTKLVIR